MSVPGHSRRFATYLRLPLYPNKRTSLPWVGMSLRGQKPKCRSGKTYRGLLVLSKSYNLTGQTLTEHHQIIGELAFPYKAPKAYRRLLELGIKALPAVRAGLRHDIADVRLHCCRFLDRYLSPETLTDLMEMLNDNDDRVRCSALHTLACDRCKDGTCRPEEAEVLPKALNLLQRDPDAHVRAMSIEVVGQFVHTNPLASAAISAAHQADKNPTVRKKAGWYVPGGPTHRRTMPRNRSISSS